MTQSCTHFRLVFVMTAVGAELREKVMALLADGVIASDVARQLGVSRQRISQISHPIVALARQTLGLARKSGKIVVPTRCTVCGREGRLHGHHRDYLRPLDVEWLCSDCHGIRHGRTIQTAKNPAAAALARIRWAKTSKAERLRVGQILKGARAARAAMRGTKRSKRSRKTAAKS